MEGTNGKITTPVLEAKRLSVGYGEVQVVRDLDLTVNRGEVTILLGANGVGKTTTLKSLAGVLPPTKGEVHLKGTRTDRPLHRRARNGLGFVSEERSVIMGLTAAENIRLAGVDRQAVLDLFPALESRMDTKGGLLSGGEQQMLTLGRMLARRPDVLLVDEMSLGLAPLIVRELLATVRRAADSGMGVLVVEQHIRQALEVADRVYVMRRGEIVFVGSTEECEDQIEEIERNYLGGVTDGA
jgi:branched-chain amino acid transport system ATP-binding protein